jgi:predicted metalloendopeptidase
MKSKKNLKIKMNNKTRRKKKFNPLTNKTKSLTEVISEFKNDNENNKLNNNIINYFLRNNTKKSHYLIKNDFYTYINDYWIHELMDNKNQMKYLIKLDDFRITQFKLFQTLNKLLMNFIHNNDNNNIVGVEVKNFYISAFKFNSVLSSKNYLKKIVAYIDSLRKDKNNIWKMLAFVNKLEITNPFGPFNLEFAPDQNEPLKYVYYMSPHNFAIFDLNVYKDENFSNKKKDEYYKKYVNFFNKYIDKLFKTTLPEDKALINKDPFYVGRLFFNIMYNKKDNFNSSYNKITSDEAINKYKFNWIEYCKEIGYRNDNIPEYFIVTDLNYFKECTELLLNEWNSDKWRSYWVWLFARFVARFTKEWHDIFYTFYGKQTQGLEESIRKTKSQSEMHFCAYAFNPLLNNLYLDYSYNEENIVYTTNLANNLKQILIDKINRNNWIDKKTKDYATLKVQTVDLIIGSKKFTQKYNEILPLLNFNPDELIENFLKINDWKNNLRINNKIEIYKTTADVDFTTYPFSFKNLPSYIVNARYETIKNSLEISSAYLQKPFLDFINYGTEYNLASIGFTIAHELSHSIDNLANNEEVSKKDRIIFKNIENAIIKQYEVFSKFDKLKYNAKNTIDEDIADISGLSICEEYLRDFCIQHNFYSLLILQHFKMFYYYYAYQMRQKISKQGIKYELIKNPHPIDKYRTNVSLSRSKYFQSLFDIKNGDKMYWKDTKPIY